MSSSPGTVTVATSPGEIVVTLMGVLCLFVIAAALHFAVDAATPVAVWWKCRFGGIAALATGLLILFTTKYRRWMFSGTERTARIDTYSLFGRSRQLASEIADLTVEARQGYGRPWNWFVLLKTDGTQVMLGPTGRFGLGAGNQTVTAVRNALANTGKDDGGKPESGING
jgi:hypothetical protein